ncbi:MAG: amidase [Alphaproteobacteria bacterium]|nr:amidase [Alphaproteobacteria bacterium]
MRQEDYLARDGLGLAALVARGEVSPEEVLDAAIARLSAMNPAINAISARFFDLGRAAIRAGLPEGPFRGVPYMTKDLETAVKGAPLANGSRLFAGRAMDYDSTLTERLKRAGLVLFAQTTSPEFGLTATTESLLHGPTRNPWNLERTPGGSSGGAAAAVATGIVPMAQASDGGGSIRTPASCCGLFGLKPSRARVPRGPYRTESWCGYSVAHAITRSVRDSAALLDATQGPERGARTIARPPERPYLEEVGRPPGRLRIALVTRPPTDVPVHPDCLDALADAGRLLEDLGHHVEEATPPVDGEALARGITAIVATDVRRILEDEGRARGRPVTEGEVELITWKLHELGGRLTGMDLLRALDAAQTAGIAWGAFTTTYDVALSPTLGKPPIELGKVALTPSDPDAYAQELAGFMPFTSLHNATGAPAMSVPLAWNTDGLPVGLMFAGRIGDEATLFRLAAQLEKARPWADRHPPLW